jgi:hypothetical protein
MSGQGKTLRGCMTENGSRAFHLRSADTCAASLVALPRAVDGKKQQ